jgi:hypothetical protein
MEATEHKVIIYSMASDVGYCDCGVGKSRRRRHLIDWPGEAWRRVALKLVKTGNNPSRGNSCSF